MDASAGHFLYATQMWIVIISNEIRQVPVIDREA